MSKRGSRRKFLTTVAAGALGFYGLTKLTDLEAQEDATVTAEEKKVAMEEAKRLIPTPEDVRKAKPLKELISKAVWASKEFKEKYLILIQMYKAYESRDEAKVKQIMAKNAELAENIRLIIDSEAAVVWYILAQDYHFIGDMKGCLETAKKSVDRYPEALATKHLRRRFLEKK